MTVNLVKGQGLGEALTNVDGKSILVSATAGAVGVGIAQGIKNFGTVAKIGTEIVSDGVISVTSQAINEGKIDIVNTGVDAVIGQAARNTVGVKIKDKVTNSKPGRQLQSEVNKQKNIARGKSRQQGIKKIDANVPATQNKLDNFTAGSAATGSGAAAGSVRKAVNPPNNEKENK